MGQEKFYIGDTIRGKIVQRLDFGITLDAYFSTESVELETGQRITVCFFESARTPCPRIGESFQATIGHSIFSREPFTTDSYFMLESVALNQSPPLTPAQTDPYRNPIAWLNELCRTAPRFET